MANETSPRKPIDPIICMFFGFLLILVSLGLAQLDWGGMVVVGFLWLAFFRWTGYLAKGSPTEPIDSIDRMCPGCPHPLALHGK
jgi:hypothetical protein